MSLKIQRVRKEFLVGRVTERVKRSALVAVAHVGNLNISDRTLVRRSLTDAGGDVTFVKNSLTAKGLEAAGAHDLAPLLRGNTLLATGPDEVPIAAALHSLSKSVPNFVVLGALLNSRQRILQHMEMERLSKLPPAEQVHMQMVAQMLPASSLQVPNVGAYLVSLLQTHVDSQSAAGGSGDSDN